MDNDLKKILYIGILIVLMCLIHFMTNDIPDYLITSIVGVITGIIGITINPNQKDIE